MNAKNPINIEVLEVLDAIDRRGSFAKAAEELNKATSAISYGVQKLEEQLDVTLFQRQGRRSVLTPAGQLVLEEGRVILQASQRLATRAKEVATGWETQIRIAVESIAYQTKFFEVITGFLDEFPSIEIDISECVLNGGWEALEHNRVDLLFGAPGPVPSHKGFRAERLAENELLPVIGGHHPQAGSVGNKRSLNKLLPELRRVVTHDTSVTEITRSAGLSNDGKVLYVQTVDQKVQAILAGAGIGHLPKSRIQPYLDSGELVALNMAPKSINDNFLAWKVSNKGKGLMALTGRLGRACS